jgi:hypothetical protein
MAKTRQENHDEHPSCSWLWIQTIKRVRGGTVNDSDFS